MQENWRKNSLTVDFFYHTAAPGDVSAHSDNGTTHPNCHSVYIFYHTADPDYRTIDPDNDTIQSDCHSVHIFHHTGDPDYPTIDPDNDTIQSDYHSVHYFYVRKRFGRKQPNIKTRCNLQVLWLICLFDFKFPGK